MSVVPTGLLLNTREIRIHGRWGNRKSEVRERIGKYPRDKETWKMGRREKEYPIDNQMRNDPRNTKEMFMSQKAFVKAAIIEFGVDNVQAAIAKVALGLMDGTCPHKTGFTPDQEKEANQYAKSVVSNYLKKDTDLNPAGYIPANPRGPRYKNPAIKSVESALKSLRAHDGDTDLIERASAKLAELKGIEDAGRVKSGVMDLDTAMATLEDLGI